MYDVVHWKLFHELIRFFHSEYRKGAVEEFVCRVYT